MTPEEKIAELVAHIKKEFPDGCGNVKCRNCPLNKYRDEGPSTESNICEMSNGRTVKPSMKHLPSTASVVSFYDGWRYFFFVIKTTMVGHHIFKRMIHRRWFYMFSKHIFFWSSCRKQFQYVDTAKQN